MHKDFAKPSCAMPERPHGLAQKAEIVLQEYILNTGTADDSPLFYNKKLERESIQPASCCSFCYLPMLR